MQMSQVAVPDNVWIALSLSLSVFVCVYLLWIHTRSILMDEGISQTLDLCVMQAI
jgi:hypothetical protein